MGELARKPGCPELAKTPLELITPRPGDGFSMFDKLISPILCGAGGFSACAFRNLLLKRPWWAGIHLHILATGIFAYVGILFRDWNFAHRMESDGVIRHYISLHPDDFPPFERKRFSEIYVPFQPSR